MHTEEEIKLKVMNFKSKCRLLGVTRKDILKQRQNIETPLYPGTFGLEFILCCRLPSYSFFKAINDQSTLIDSLIDSLVLRYALNLKKEARVADEHYPKVVGKFRRE